MLENSGAAVERLFGSQAPRHAAPGHPVARYSGSERGTGRRPRERGRAERGDGQNTTPEEGRARRGEARYAAQGNATSGRVTPGREGSGRDEARRDGAGREGTRRDGAPRPEKGAAYGGRAGRGPGADAGYRAGEASYRAPDAGRHERDTIRLDAYRPPHDWDLDDGGDTDYDEDPDDDAEADLDAEYDADGEYDEEADDDADAEYGGAPRYEADAAYETHADYGASVAHRGDDSSYRGGREYRGGGREYRGADSGYLAADGGYPDADSGDPDAHGGARLAGGGYRRGQTRQHRGGGGYRGAAVYHADRPPGYGAGLAGADADGYGAATDAQEPDDRTEVLINHGRRHARPKGIRRWLKHWRAIGIGVVGVVAGAVALALVLPGSDPTWPSSVALVQKEIDVACENPNVVSEPSQVNFACGKETRSILWVFSLLTSGDNPNYSDAANGRKGLEPITPAQGGDVAWSLNLHHPYEPANPTDSLAVAARAINNIIGGATLTSSNGSAVVQPGLESTAANCDRYTGSSALVTRQGFPSVCAQPVTSAAGQAALVSDVFKQWMVGAPAQVATEAGVLFENADDPGAPSVQAILNSLPQTGL